MDRDDKLRDIFRDVFGLAPEQFHDGLTASDVQAWDSVAHLTLLLALEQGFAVSFEPEEAAMLTSVRAVKQALGTCLARMKVDAHG